MINNSVWSKIKQFWKISDILSFAPSGIFRNSSLPIKADGKIIFISKSRRRIARSCSLHSARRFNPHWSTIIWSDDFEPSIIILSWSKTLFALRWKYLFSSAPLVFLLSSLTCFKLDTRVFIAFTLLICSWMISSKASSGAIGVHIIGLVFEIIASFFFSSFNKIG